MSERHTDMTISLRELVSYLGLGAGELTPTDDGFDVVHMGEGMYLVAHGTTESAPMYFAEARNLLIRAAHFVRQCQADVRRGLN